MPPRTPTSARTPGRISFAVRVIARAGRSAVGGSRDGALLVRVAAPPVEGAANEAVIAAVATALAVPRGAVRIERGARARRKVLSAPAIAAGRLAELLKERLAGRRIQGA